VGVRELPEAHTFDFITGEGESQNKGNFFLIVGGLYSVTAWRENDQEGHSVY